MQILIEAPDFVPHFLAIIVEKKLQRNIYIFPKKRIKDKDRCSVKLCEMH